MKVTVAPWRLHPKLGATQGANTHAARRARPWHPWAGRGWDGTGRTQEAWWVPWAPRRRDPPRHHERVLAAMGGSGGV